MGGYPVKRICALLLTALILCGCAKIDDTPAVETAAPAETVPAATVPSDGDPKNVTCKGSYTGQGKEHLHSVSWCPCTGPIRHFCRK